MKNYLIGEKSFNIPTDWKDITLKKYVDIAKLQKLKENFKIEELFLLRMIEILTDANEGDLDDMTMEQIAQITVDLSFISSQNNFELKNHLNIEGVDFVLPSDLNKLTMGEYVSIKTLQENMNDDIDVLPFILAIILRPGKLINDEYTGKSYWKQSKFDVEGIDYRKELFLKQPVMDLMGAVNFFLDGKITSSNNIQDSISQDQKQVQSL